VTGAKMSVDQAECVTGARSAASRKPRHFDLEAAAAARNNLQVHVLSGGELVGRERELEAGRRFLSAVPDKPAALLIRGEAGIGKTVLWRRLVDDARALGERVLVSRCFEADMPLGFATLADLLEDVVDEVAGDLPPAQHAALDFALRRSDQSGGAPDALTVSRGVLSVLRSLANAAPLVLAVDDVQWIDSASARVLAFALRRLEGEPIGALLTWRSAESEDEQPALVSSLAEGRLESVELGPLSVGALQQLLRTRLGISLPRTVLVRLTEASGGNPMYALEFARALPGPTAMATLPMPPSLRALVRDRLALLPAPIRPLLELVATLGQPTLALLARAFPAALDESLAAAVAAGALIHEDDGHIRFSHPLLASAVYADVHSDRRRELHGLAAAVVVDEEARARHLALATAEPDKEIAALLDRAAESAHRRGAPDAAAELAEWAQRLTPAEQRADRDRRLIRAAGYLVEADDERGAGRLLEPLLETDVPDAVRAEALLVRASAEWNNRPKLIELLREALDYSSDEPRVRCEALIRYAWQAGHGTGDEASAERWARQALALAHQVGDPGLLEQAAALVVWTAGFRAQPPGELPPEPADSVTPGVRTPPWGQPRRAALGLQLMWRGRLADARALLVQELARASRQGSEVRLATFHFNLSELELRAGNWELARRYAEDGFGIMHEARGNGALMLLSARGRVAAHQGRIDEAVADARAVLDRAESQLDIHQRVRSWMTLGFLHLSRNEPDAAWRFFDGLPELREKMGVREPGCLPLLPDATETLVTFGRLDEAERLISGMEESARRLDHLWAIPVAQRCRGLLLLGRGELAPAIATLDASAAAFEAIGYPFDRARSLLGLGDALRRAGRRRLAAEHLDAARALFERLGAQLWLERTRTELRLAEPRPRRDHELTAAETRVARLVATGATNKEVAARLFTTVATVEAHLTRIYRKLDLRSRSELARKVAEGSLTLPVP
jgi:DNA-binding NarL/FixJ family response regulator